MTRRWVLVLLCAAIAAPSIALAASSKQELKQRFKERYPKLVELKRAGKIGETAAGYVDFVEPRYANDGAAAKLVAAENSDRRELYALIAEEAGTTAEAVARRNARRNFENAEPDDYLRLPSGKWVQKKELREK